MNSTIKQKTGKCIDCPQDATDKPLIAKRCQFHYQKYRAKVCSERKEKAAAGAGGRAVGGFNTPKPDIPETEQTVWTNTILPFVVTFDDDIPLDLMQGFKGLRQDNKDYAAEPIVLEGEIETNDEYRTRIRKELLYGNFVHKHKSKDDTAAGAGVGSKKKVFNSMKESGKILAGTWMEGMMEELVRKAEEIDKSDLKHPPPAPRSRKIPSKKPKTTGTKAWYDYHIQHTNYICQECGTQLNPFHENGGYACQAHVLPKSEHNGFPSVKNVLENHLLLGASCGCHSRFDKSWLSASKMGVFPLAYAIVQKLIHLLSETEKNRLPEVFIKPLP